MFKKSLSSLLAVILVMSVFAVLPCSSHAHVIELAEEGANSLTLSQVTDWLNNEIRIGATRGSGECVDFCNYYLTNCWGISAIGGNANTWKDKCPSGWTVINLNRNFDNCQIGDLLVEDYSPYGHVSVYYGKENGKHMVVDQNNQGRRYTGKGRLWADFSNPMYCFRPNYGGGENKHPTGSVDEMYSDNEQLIVRGWAYDPDSPDTPVSLHVYVGNIAGSGASCYTTDVNGNEIKANQYRPDMNRNWGFEVRINVRERGNQNIFIYAINNEGGHNPELGLTAGVSRNVFINQVPMGHVDKITGGVGSINLTGWAFDKDDVSQSLYVHVYIGGNSGTVGAECVSVYANVSRKDVDIAYHVGEYHGFYASIPTTKTGNQEVYVYAIDIGKGENKEIGHATVNIAPVNNPVSSLDSLTGGNGSIHVFGWSYDKDDLTQSLAVHVYIGGSSSTLGAECVEITANVSRKDVDDAFHVGEFHGFYATIPTSKTGEQEVYVYAINIGSGENKEIGHGTVTITADTLKPVCIDQYFSFETPDSFRVNVVPIDNVGIKKVRVATWSQEDSSDLIWRDASYNGTDTYYVDINRADHSKIMNAVYTNHIYIYDYSDNYIGIEMKKDYRIASETGAILPDGEYRIITAVNENRALNVENDDVGSGANVNIYSNLTNTKQTFELTYLGNGFYTIANSNSGCVLDVNGDTYFNNTNVMQYNANGGANQEWMIKQAGDGYYYIISRTNGLALDVTNGEDRDGANVAVHTQNQSTAQKWKLLITKPIEDEQTPETHLLLGDTDDDGEVTIIDATAIQRHLASLPTRAYNEKAADADEDGKVTILDATAIQRHLASLPTNERIGTLI